MPDVMALESTYMGRFSLGQGLENLSAAPFNAERHREAFTPSPSSRPATARAASSRCRPTSARHLALSQGTCSTAPASPRPT